MNSVHGRVLEEGILFRISSDVAFAPTRQSIRLAALFLRVFSLEDITSQPFVFHFQLVDGLIPGPSRNYWFTSRVTFENTILVYHLQSPMHRTYLR